MENRNIAAVVVTYNRLGLLKQCVERLQRQTVPCHIWIVDNASTDGTGEWARAQEGLRYRNTGANLGGAGGFQAGIRWAVEAGASHLWIMDDDCLPEETALEALVNADALLKGHYGWLSSAVLWVDGTGCVMNRQLLSKRYVTFESLLGDGLVEARQASFVSLFLPAAMVRQVGLPIAEFFIWGDDAEFTRRVQRQSPCFVVGKSRVVHAMKENTGIGVERDVPERIRRYRYAFRNEAYLYRQEGFRGRLYYLANCGRAVARVLVKSRDHRGRRLGAIFGGMWDGLFFRPRVQFCEED